jgi:hypothetical protein
VSGAAHTVLRVHDDDRVNPGEAALQELLASMAEHTSDPHRRERLLDALITTKPLSEWSAEELAMLADTCAYVISLSRINSELRAISDESDSAS